MKYFPYPRVRPGQLEFMHDVEKALKKGGNLVAHAPTGIGKTAGVLAPALKHVLSAGKTIFFLTPKHTQHIIVVDTLQRIQKKAAVSVTAVDIIGKQWMCPHKTGDLSSREFNEYCRARKKDETCVQYNNVRRGRLTSRAKEVVDEIKGTVLHNEDLRKLCSKHDLCPYEICVEAGKSADVVICDYFHVFSPPVRKAFLTKLGKDVCDSIIIVDEAHNLPDRVRKLLSHSLSDYSIKRAIKEASTVGYHQLAEDLRDLGGVLRSLGRGLKPGCEAFIVREDFMNKLAEKLRLEYDEFTVDLEALGGEVLKIPGRYRSYSKNISRFLEVWKGPDIGFARILRKLDRGVSLYYKCLDPSVSCGGVFSEASCSVLMSGTLVPLKMYGDVLGLSESKTLERAYQSPFPPENRLALIVPGVTTKYSCRSEYMYDRYARLLSEIISVVSGNVAVFYPAYRLLESVTGRLDSGIGKEFLVERQGMRKDDRRRLFERLVKLHGNGGGVLFGVQAGSFSEGLDYADNLLDCVVVVGLPLERPDLETQALIDYYDFRFERGWDYGYIYPAMNRALQAAGRCIRSERDRGAVVLLDERFKWGNYRKCFPVDFEFIVTEEPQKYLKKFFGE
jgi:DNA excision repair protein ERCC-2